jgi:hypothetical protein
MCGLLYTAAVEIMETVVAIVSDGRDGETLSKETLESIVALIVQEYHLLDENMNPYAGPYAKQEV